MASSKKPTDREPHHQQIKMGRAAVPPELYDKKRREELGLSSGVNEAGDYMVELNLLHRGGVEAADQRFRRIYQEEVGDDAPPPRRIAKTYYACRISINQLRKIVLKDEQDPARDRGIYRIWPDFPVQALIDRSTATVKADAAQRAYAASGAGITWAVVDSGIEASHPHFGPAGEDVEARKRHLLLHEDVADLHRNFLLPDPDADPNQTEEARAALVKQHRDEALTDEFGHGTHVAGIIAGGLAEKEEATFDCRVFERKFETSPAGDKVSETVEERSRATDFRLLQGVAPRCRLISLKVLDEKGRGKTSDIILALDYIRERVNGNPKLLRVQGVNLSVGYEFDAEMFACGQSPLCVEVDRLVQAGVVVVTAAGNTGYGILNALSAGRSTRVGLANTINDPGNAALAITVGATHRDSPHTYGVSYFSSKGPTGDGRLKPDLVAPGERITSCAAGKKVDEIRKKGGGEIVPLQDVPSGKGGAVPAKRLAAYLDDSGTSMAAPHVSGAIAAFLSIRREFIGKPLEVKRIFLESATSLGRERYFEGHGLVDLIRAIQSV